MLRHYPLQWVGAGVAGARNRREFDGVRGYVMFVGHPRTGHSLVGALLDAHPNALVAHELDALKYVQAGFDRRRLFALLQRAERTRVASGHVSSTGYRYLVPNQWQGRHERLDLIGDKKGGRSTARLGGDISLLQRIHEVVGVDVYVVQVVRNPYDVIATMHRRAPRRSLDDTAELFFALSDTVREVRRR
ncbi:MAG: sulfotransferase, partial [Ilumatobacteraceae bacterium]